ncbi:MAG: T9SS type A sorting domain-containing protein, partial [Proteobacteria bacterium]
GTNSPGSVTSTHATGALTFYFVSDEFVTDGGWEAQIDCTSLGIDSQQVQSISFYPNPVTDVLHIKGTTILKSFEVFDMNLRRMQSGQANATEISIDLSGHSAGVYMIRLIDEEGRASNIKVSHR